MMMRRRPLLRAAALGGSAYMIGKNAGRRSGEQEAGRRSGEQEHAAATQDQDSGRLAAQVPAQPGPPVADQLSQLSTLHAQGALSDDEFATAKARLLRG